MAQVKIPTANLTVDQTSTFLSADAASGVNSVTVKNITGFAVNQILVLGDLGSEGSEIIKTHGSSAPSGSTITLLTTTSLPHNASSSVTVLQYDRIELSTATTVSGAKTVLNGGSTFPIVADSQFTTYEDSLNSTGYYFIRFYNSISATYSSYSDPIPVAGWLRNQVGYMVNRALADLGQKLSPSITLVDCYEWINECLHEIEGKQIRWPEHLKFDYSLTTLTAGDYQYTLPTDIYDDESNRSIVAVRIGTQGESLDYLDPVAFEARLAGVAVTTAAEAGSVGETAIDLTNAADFADSGTITYYASGTQYTFTYTGKSSNTLTGIPASGTGSITQAFSSGDTLYQGATFGVPTSLTVREGSLDFYPIPGAEEHGSRVALDYATVVTRVDTDGDEIDLHRSDIVQPYLTWRIKMKARNEGSLDMNDGYYLKYKERLNDAIRTASRIPNTFKPRINQMRKR